MRRFFAVSASRRVLATAALSRWQSEGATPEGGAEDAAKDPAVVEFEKLKESVAANQKIVDDLKKEVLYTAANAENARREFRDSVTSEKFKGESAFAHDLLESADALDKVCRNIADYRVEKPDLPPKLTSLLSGVDLSLKVVLKVLSRKDVTRMDINVGDNFNTEAMKSIMTTPATAEILAGKVSEVVKHGYMRREAVLRQAEVGVAEEPEK